MNNKIGESIKIKEGVYAVVAPSSYTQILLAQWASGGYYITSFKMFFHEQEGIVVIEGRVQLKDGAIIEYESLIYDRTQK